MIGEPKNTRLTLLEQWGDVSPFSLQKIHKFFNTLNNLSIIETRKSTLSSTSIYEMIIEYKGVKIVLTQHHAHVVISKLTKDGEQSFVTSVDNMKDALIEVEEIAAEIEIAYMQNLKEAI